MPPRWRAVAERAHTCAGSVHELGDAIYDALLKDADELPRDFISSLRKIYVETSLLSLLDEFRAEELNAIREKLKPDSFGISVMDHIDLCSLKDVPLNDAVEQGIHNAALERASISARQIYEHYIVDGFDQHDKDRAGEVFDRIGQGMCHPVLDNIGKAIIASAHGEKSTRKATKKIGIDAPGPALVK